MSSFLLVPPLLVDGFLFLLFGKGLRPGRTALLTSLATQARGHELDAKTTRYTRRVTAVWAGSAGLLFLLMAPGLVFESWRPVALTLAFAQGPFYATLLIAEHVFRRHHLDHIKHMRFIDFLRFLRRFDYAAALRD